jgi:D-beta-D-heptose 7-phosphate kinase/D-beta-D-heptose 1-phosphate adenosyltransferase
MDIFKACELACYASARSVEHRGVHVVTMQDIKRKVIFTNGVFDVLHAGHLELLKYAKSRGDKLVVGINSDSSVKRLKGSNRPINDIATRIEQLEVLPWVDEVKVFTEDTPENLLKTVNPDLIIKGGDYIIETVVGHQDYDVEIFPTVKGKSTTNIVERINENFSNRT